MIEPSLPAQIFLVFASFLTSAISGTLGMSGGIVLLALMAPFFPVQALIPLHGLTVACNATSRLIWIYPSIDWKAVLFWLAGSVIGALVGVSLFVQISETTLTLILAAGMLLFTWTPLHLIKKLRADSMPAWTGLAIFTSFCGMFIGAGNALGCAALQNFAKTRQGFVATTAAMAISQHIPKVMAFTFQLDFSLRPYLPLLCGMVLAGLVGARIGKFALSRLPEKTFRWLIKLIITAVTIKLLYGLWT